MIPTLFQIGPLPIHSFGLMMVFCFLAAWRMLYLRLEQFGENPEIAERLVTWAAFGGIIGARVGYLISFPTELIQRPIETIFGGAGFIFYWGFIGGVLSCWILLRKEKIDFLKFADIASPSLALGYAIGRIGCQLSGDGDYGKVTNVAWAMSYSLGVIPTPAGVLVHPTPVYETLGSLFITCVLLNSFINSKFFGKGALFGLYLILSGLARFLVEYVRIEPHVYMGLTQAQVMGVAMMLIGTIFLVFLKPSVRVNPGT